MVATEIHGSALRAPRDGLKVTERRGGYVFSEDGEIAPAQAMGRLLGFSLILAGLGLLAVPVGVGMVVKLGIVAGLVVLGGIFAMRPGPAPRMELEVDLDKRLLRRRRLAATGQAQLVAQWSFDAIEGIDVDGGAGRGALFVLTRGRKEALLRGAPEALRGAARRIGADLLRTRRAV
ncbi:MAG: hypothetical protein JXQ91_04225 [Vannielia sp.]|uniref:hypothetical protein n=1 Tax=Rhodobacterales TaxID=204455 RepID=UPI0020950F4E|nr:hypothetical protein [Oceanicola sp. 502str15]MCO6381866.1 hypothetical protein [Oceanicola sp. 502str15]